MRALLALLAFAGCVPYSQYGWYPWPTPSTGQASGVETPAGPVVTDGTITAGSLPIFVYGGGARIAAGPRDEAGRWISASLGGLPSVDVPAFEGTQDDWRKIMACTRAHFVGLPVSLVDQQPTTPDHLLLVVGGRANLFGKSNQWGFAPLLPQVVTERGVGFVFSADVWGDRNGQICEAISHEIGHMLGLDHVWPECHDVMSLNDRCARDVPRAGFLGETRAILEKSLASYRIVYEPAPTPNVSAAIADAGWGRVIPITIDATRPLRDVIVRSRTPTGPKGEYHMTIEGLRATTNLPAYEMGEWTLLVELHYTDGGVARTGSYTVNVQ